MKTVPTEPAKATHPLSGEDSPDGVPVSGLAAREGRAHNDVEPPPTPEFVAGEEKVPSTKPSIVPGPMDEPVVEIRTGPQPVATRIRRSRRPVASYRALGGSVGVALVVTPLVVADWPRSSGILCAAIGGAVLVFSLLFEGARRAP